MKRLGYTLLLSILLACNAQSGTGNSKTDSTGTEKKQADGVATNAPSGCGNSLLFHKGTILEGASYDGTGKVVNTSVATVTDVTDEGGVTVSHVESKTKKDGQADEKIIKTAYRCDGQSLTIDLSNMLGEGSAKGNVEASGVSFPLTVSEGETLPDATYSVTMNMAGKEIKATTHVTQRKVEAKEPVTIDGGTFTCYKISSVMDVSTEMPGMDEKRKQAMEAMKAKLPKNKMVIWYAPDATVLKMEYYMGDKLISRNQVTAIKK